MNVNSGAVIWKLYNNTFIVKTPSVKIGFDIQRGIPGHENELNHTIDHREPYRLNSVRLGDDPSFPWIQMATGERSHYYSIIKAE